MRQTVRWTTDLDVEIEATVIGTFEKSDFGVPGSPEWMELVSCEVEWPILANGETVSRDDMIESAGQEETKKMEETLCGLIDDGAWE